MSKTYASKVAFGKIDVDDNSDAAMDFDISAVPTFVFFDGETATAKFSGADPVRLETMVKELMEK
jgi:thioredoxin 1